MGVVDPKSMMGKDLVIFFRERFKGDLKGSHCVPESRNDRSLPWFIERIQYADFQGIRIRQIGVMNIARPLWVKKD